MTAAKLYKNIWMYPTMLWIFKCCYAGNEDVLDALEYCELGTIYYDELEACIRSRHLSIYSNENMLDKIQRRISAVVDRVFPLSIIEFAIKGLVKESNEKAWKIVFLLLFRVKHETDRDLYEIIVAALTSAPSYEDQ